MKSMTTKVENPLKHGRKKGTLRVIKFHLFGMSIKTLGSLEKIRVGRETGNTHIFFTLCEIFNGFIHAFYLSKIHFH